MFTSYVVYVDNFLFQLSRLIGTFLSHLASGSTRSFAFRLLIHAAKHLLNVDVFIATDCILRILFRRAKSWTIVSQENNVYKNLPNTSRSMGCTETNKADGMSVNQTTRVFFFTGTEEQASQ